MLSSERIRRFVESSRSKALPGSLLTDGEHINWDNFRTYMRTLAAMEEDLFLKEHKHRESLAKRPFSLRKDNSRRSLNSNGSGNSNDNDISLEDEMTQRLNAVPVYNREKEKYIDPTEPYWQENIRGSVRWETEDRWTIGIRSLLRGIRMDNALLYERLR